MRDFIVYEGMAMLALPDDDRVGLRERFDVVVGGFDELEKFDTAGVEPLVTVLDLCNVMREDVPVKFMSREELMSNAPEQHDGYFQVPATVL